MIINFIYSCYNWNYLVLKYQTRRILSQRMLPFSFPLAYSLLFFSAAGKPLLVFRDGTSGKDSLNRKIFEQFDRCIKIIDK